MNIYFLPKFKIPLSYTWQTKLISPVKITCQTEQLHNMDLCLALKNLNTVVCGSGNCVQLPNWALLVCPMIYRRTSHFLFHLLPEHTHQITPVFTEVRGQPTVKTHQCVREYCTPTAYSCTMFDAGSVHTAADGRLSQRLCLQYRFFNADSFFLQ